MKYKNTNKLMIVAHADDELIWAGEKLLKEKGEWDILCVVSPDWQSTFRIPIFLEKVSDYLNVNTELLFFKDSGWKNDREANPIDGDIRTPILNKIKSKDWSIILTHGVTGEYGHLHHIQVHEAVVSILKERYELDKLLVFDPIKHDTKLELSQEKLELFKHTYDDESNLPPNHPRKWIHGWNTNSGWEENFKPFTKTPTTNLINYNYMTRPAKFCLDESEKFYKSFGVSKVNTNTFNLENMVDGDILFVKTDYIYHEVLGNRGMVSMEGKFLLDYLPHINKDFILVTGVSSYSVDKGFPSYLKILYHKHLIKWFCTNPPTINHPKLEWLPIGFQEKERPGGDMQILNKYYKNSTPWLNKENKLYIPFHTLDTSPDRAELINKLSKYNFCIIEKSRLGFEEYLDKLDKYKYVLSLRGTGWDCHRHYESLLVGSVPIMEEGPILQSFRQENLPVLSLSDVNPYMFNQEFNFLKVKEFLTMDYHINKLKLTQNNHDKS